MKLKINLLYILWITCIPDNGENSQNGPKSIYTIPAPQTLEGLIELKMYERRLKQKELAKLLGIGEPKLFQLMSRKRKPDVAFLKAAYDHLGIDGNPLLEFA
jgi:HTH-type transcriptional regulator / antitoxin HigA